MAWRQIERSEWEAFLTGFGSEHDGWLVTVTSGEHARAKGRLRGARLEQKNGFERVVLALADGDRDALVVPAPTRISLDEDAVGAHRALAIEGAEGEVRLQFRVAIRSEMVDGVY